jgi:DNA-binding transcriptional LysR family regulator
MSQMNYAHLRKLDLNLLLAFDAVMSERSVTRAGSRLHLTQGAVSHALTRLRATVGDELFVRGKDGMRPTPRALALAGPVREVLSNLDAAIGPSRFDPASSSETFRIASTDYFTTLALPKLVRRIEAEAPHVDVRFLSHTVTNVPDLLDRQEVELAVGFFQNSLRNLLPPHCEWAVLCDDHLECVMRKSHRLARRSLTLADYLAATHLLFSLSGEASSTIDRHLRKKKLTRRIGFTVTHYLVAGPVLAQSDMIMTVPSRIARLYADQHGLVRKRLPLKVPLAATQLVWNSWMDRAPAHRWLRALIMDVCGSL